MNDQKTYNEVNWEKISRYISGEMPDAEKTEFNSFLHTNDVYSEIVEALQSDMKSVDDFQTAEKTFHTETAWQQVKSRIDNDDLHVKSRRNIMQWSLLKVAAVMLALVALGATSYLGYQKLNPTKVTVTASNNDQGKVVTLPDGSEITLNRNTKISYPKTFNSDIRSVQLTGEAFFSITKNAQKPFIIATPQAQIKVLGTSFNVNASTQKTEVLVETGTVQLNVLKTPAKNLILTHGDFGMVKDTNLTKSASADINYLSWKTQKMVFQATPLHQVAAIIEKTYGVEISLSSATSQNLLFTSTFDREPLHIILESIGKSFNLTFEKNNNRIIFMEP